MAEELQDVQQERAEVKKALRENGVFLGMSGDTLSQYFLQLNEKENLLLSQQLQAAEAAGTDDATPEAASTEVAAPQAPEAATPEVAAPQATHGYPEVAAEPAPVAEPVPVPAAEPVPVAVAEPVPVPVAAEPVPVAVAQLVARDLPSGTPTPLDRDSLLSVAAHMSSYEASSSESGKALRALASLAYTTPAKVADHSDVVPQILRLLALHPNDDNVQIYGMRSLCNIASNQSVALNKLSSEAVLNALVGTMASRSEHKEISHKACETVSRLIAADITPPRPADAPPAWLDNGPLKILFTLLPAEDLAGREVVVQLIREFVSNEVATSEYLAKRLISCAEKAKESDWAATEWLLLAKQVAKAEIPLMSEALITHGAIAGAVGVMVAQLSSVPAQFAGMEALSALVSDRLTGLEAFAVAGGMVRIEEALATHPGELALQTKGIRTMASAAKWSEELVTKSAYNCRRSLALTMAAMFNHEDDEDLQAAGCEALRRYLDRAGCAEDVRAGGGVALINGAMAKHGSNKQVQDVGASILRSLA